MTPPALIRVITLSAHTIFIYYLLFPYCTTHPFLYIPLSSTGILILSSLDPLLGTILYLVHLLHNKLKFGSPASPSLASYTSCLTLVALTHPPSTSCFDAAACFQLPCHLQAISCPPHLIFGHHINCEMPPLAFLVPCHMQAGLYSLHFIFRHPHLFFGAMSHASELTFPPTLCLDTCCFISVPVALFRHWLFYFDISYFMSVPPLSFQVPC